MRPGPHLTAWRWSSSLSFPLSHLDTVPSRALYATGWNPMPHGLGSWALIRLECPALWKRPSLTLGSRSSFIPTPGLMFLYFTKDPSSLALETPAKRGYNCITRSSYVEGFSPRTSEHDLRWSSLFFVFPLPTFVCLDGAAGAAYGSSQAWHPNDPSIDRTFGIWPTHSHRNATSKPGLRPTPQLMATLDPSLPERGQGSNLNTPGSFSGSVPGQHPRKPCSRVCTERAEIRSLRWPLIQ